ncbi:MAG: Crp/Fnr family transcriptional regulator [Nitrosospira sp.]|nr:Crp/Fnr family transcriptional regulator [Nitrosospira sp.]
MPDLQTPKQNFFLASLPETDYERLRSCLELVSLPQGWAVYEKGRELDLVYFPTTSVIALHAISDNGQSVNMAVIGNEGVFGISMLMGRETALKRAVVQSAGDGYRLKVIHLMKEFELGSPVRYLLQHHTRSLIARIAETALLNTPVNASMNAPGNVPENCSQSRAPGKFYASAAEALRNRMSEHRTREWPIHGSLLAGTLVK